MLSSSCLVSRPGPRNPLWLFMAAYASLGLRLTKFDFNVGSSGMHRCCRLSGVGRAASSLGIRVTWGRRGLGREDAIIRGLIFVPIFTKFLTQMHRDALSANPAAASETSRDEHGVDSRFLFAEGEHYGNTAGSHHTLLRLQADGHAGLHRLPDVHPAPRPSTGESIPPCAMVPRS